MTEIASFGREMSGREYYPHSSSQSYQSHFLAALLHLVSTIGTSSQLSAAIGFILHFLNSSYDIV